MKYIMNNILNTIKRFEPSKIEDSFVSQENLEQLQQNFDKEHEQFVQHLQRFLEVYETKKRNN